MAGSCLVVLVVLVLVLTTLDALPLSLDEGQTCSDSSGSAGVCRLLKNCPQAVSRLRSGQRPVRCGFVGFDEVVCCVGAKVEEGVRSVAKERKNEKACLSYRKNEVRRIGFFILGGEEAKEGEFPHMAALGYKPSGDNKWSWRCGGTLISDRYVLTAAHCVTDRNMGQPKVVRLGQVDIGSRLPSGADYMVENVTWHPRYKKKFNYDDVALIRLATKVRFTGDVGPACLFSRRSEPSQSLIATGWGATEGSGATTSVRLLKANLTTVPLNDCRNTYKAVPKLPEGLSADMMCAGDPEGEADTCVGDSGGPLQILEDPKTSVYSVVGVTSFGPKPCGGKKPSVYVKVSSYLDWIEGIVWA